MRVCQCAAEKGRALHSCWCESVKAASASSGGVSARTTGLLARIHCGLLLASSPSASLSVSAPASRIRACIGIPAPHW